MGKYGHYSYDRTGWPHACNVLYSANGGHETELAPPGAGKHLVVLGVCSDNEIYLRKDPNGATTSGDILVFVPGDADGIRFPGTVRVPENVGLYIDNPNGGPLSIFYYIQDNSLI